MTKFLGQVIAKIVYYLDSNVQELFKDNLEPNDALIDTWVEILPQYTRMMPYTLTNSTNTILPAIQNVSLPTT